MNVPIFAKPVNIVSFRNRRAFIRFLKKYRIDYLSWGRRKRTKLWNEILVGDAVYMTGDVFGEPDVVVRCIIAVATRMVMHHPEHGFLVLIEYKLEDDGEYKPRKFTNSSLSEKMHMHADGTPLETPIETIQHCAKDEAGIILKKRDFTKKSLIFQDRSHIVWGDAEFVEQDYDFAGKYLDPNFKTFKQIAHYTLFLHIRHYHDGWRIDPDTGYASRFIPANTPTMPAEDLRMLLRAQQRAEKNKKPPLE